MGCGMSAYGCVVNALNSRSSYGLRIPVTVMYAYSPSCNHSLSMLAQQSVHEFIELVEKDKGLYGWYRNQSTIIRQDVYSIHPDRRLELLHTVLTIHVFTPVVTVPYLIIIHITVHYAYASMKTIQL